MRVRVNGFKKAGAGWTVESETVVGEGEVRKVETLLGEGVTRTVETLFAEGLTRTEEETLFGEGLTRTLDLTLFGEGMTRTVEILFVGRVTRKVDLFFFTKVAKNDDGASGILQARMRKISKRGTTYRMTILKVRSVEQLLCVMLSDSKTIERLAHNFSTCDACRDW